MRTPASVTNLRAHLRMATIAILLPVALLAAYTLAYLATLEGKVYRPIGVDPKTGINIFAIEPNFRIDDATGEWFFWPAVAADRRIRIDYWQTIHNSLNGRTWRNP